MMINAESVEKGEEPFPRFLKDFSYNRIQFSGGVFSKELENKRFTR
jgi:hypothetical protein